MGVRASFLVDAARLTGYPVNEVAGWRGRGHGDFRVLEGVVLHHTADGPTGIYPSLGVVRDGRAGLAGPLANLGLGRDGTIFVIADGVAWHAGTSAWAGFTDLNDEFLGIEAESTGTRDDWTPQQRDCYPRLVAALLYYIRRGADRACGHKECATPAGRKIDPAFWDLAAMRAQVANYLADPLRRIPRLAQEDDMPTAREIADAILDTQVTRQGDFLPPGANKTVTSLRNELAYMTNESYRTASVSAKVDKLLEAPTAQVDLDALAERVVEIVAGAGIAQQVIDALGARLSKPAQ